MDVPAGNYGPVYITITVSAKWPQVFHEEHHIYHLSFFYYLLFIIYHLSLCIDLIHQRVTIKDNQPNGFHKTFNGVGEGKEIANFELVCLVPLLSFTTSFSSPKDLRIFVVCLFVSLSLIYYLQPRDQAKSYEVIAEHSEDGGKTFKPNDVS